MAVTLRAPKKKPANSSAKASTKGQKAERTRERIIAAAGQVVGEVGYPSASIARITEAAGLSAGLFYYYYESREELFDDLLPSLGKEMVEFIVNQISHLPWGIEREMAGFSAYFDYLEQSPQFFRVFTEAQVYAPKAYQAHLQWIIDNYVVGLKRQVKLGHLHVVASDLMTLAYTLTGIRNYATQMLYGSRASDQASKEAMMRVYRQILSGVFTE
jgi:AcrR family transcriptional regulator